MADHASSTGAEHGATRQLTALISWLWVLVPFLWGVWELLIKVVPLFSR